VLRARDELASQSGERAAFVSFVVGAAARVIARNPAANTSVVGTLRPRLVQYDRVCAKVMFDKRIDGTRAVVAGMVEDADKLDVTAIQRRISYYKDNPVEALPELAPLRKLHRLPVLLGRAAYALALRSASRHHNLLGSFTVSSLGHRPIQDFFPISANTLCFGIGAMEDTPVVREGTITVRPMLPLSLTFDHTAIDGGLASDVLAQLKEALETFHLSEASHAG